MNTTGYDVYMQSHYKVTDWDGCKHFDTLECAQSFYYDYIKDVVNNGSYWESESVTLHDCGDAQAILMSFEITNNML